MSLFRHIREMDETYTNHLSYACRLGATLIISGVCFVVHGVLPFIPPPEFFNLDSTYDRVKEVWERVNRNRDVSPKENP